MHARMGFDRREKNQITMASASAASAARMSPPLLLLLLLQANTNLPKWGPIFPPPALPRLAGLTNQQQESQATSLSLPRFHCCTTTASRCRDQRKKIKARYWGNSCHVRSPSLPFSLYIVYILYEYLQCGGGGRKEGGRKKVKVAASVCRTVRVLFSLTRRKKILFF